MESNTDISNNIQKLNAKAKKLHKCPHCGDSPRYTIHAQCTDGSHLISLGCCFKKVGRYKQVTQAWQRRGKGNG